MQLQKWLYFNRSCVYSTYCFPSKLLSNCETRHTLNILFVDHLKQVLIPLHVEPVNLKANKQNYFSVPSNKIS